ncbi:hypothetical protein VFPFJ_00280 [Purpureocillium lilacinum]|uniref:Uncharacterized protein n=1 Tax=Purpureocillium lilacinum TaxID=33203 RepID=A0A179H9V5_PURLI|nr:hypothetical protein VFPFJ_00280 [Purpureocillium lilacinum]OAQ86209.1 hypothetical protein VFPBJ_00249 [Purpureocillium lilacinum]OAQ94171.1 hypothetical protein VFPFJ_00280 [Purpureocillium lilacinum]
MRICIHTVRRWAHQTGRKQVCGRCEGVVPSRVPSRLRCLPRLAPGLLPQMVLRQILVLPDTNWQPAVTSPRLASPRHGRRAALLVTRSLHGALRVDATMARGKYLAPPTGTSLSSTVDTRPRRNHHPPWSRRHTHFRDWTHAHGMEWHGKLGSHTARASPSWGGSGAAAGTPGAVAQRPVHGSLEWTPSLSGLFPCSTITPGRTPPAASPRLPVRSSSTGQPRGGGQNFVNGLSIACRCDADQGYGHYHCRTCPALRNWPRRPPPEQNQLRCRLHLPMRCSSTPQGERRAAATHLQCLPNREAGVPGGCACVSDRTALAPGSVAQRARTHTTCHRP